MQYYRTKIDCDYENMNNIEEIVEKQIFCKIKEFSKLKNIKIMRNIDDEYIIFIDGVYLTKEWFYDKISFDEIKIEIYMTLNTFCQTHREKRIDLYKSIKTKLYNNQILCFGGDVQIFPQLKNYDKIFIVSNNDVVII